MSLLDVDNQRFSCINYKTHANVQSCFSYCAQAQEVLKYSLPPIIYVQGCTSHYRCVYPQDEDLGTSVMAKDRPHCNLSGCKGEEESINKGVNISRGMLSALIVDMIFW